MGEHKRYKFVKKELGDGTSWIECVPEPSAISGIENGQFGLLAGHETSPTEMEELSIMLNRMISELIFIPYGTSEL